jgi:hypothetical protein
MTQCNALLPESQFYKIALDIREMGFEQSVISIDIVAVSLANRNVEDSHVDPPLFVQSSHAF